MSGTGAAGPAAVAIGRNEGERLVRCLAALRAALGPAGRIVYVDSGSSDGSVAAARAAGAEVVELDLALPFTAARARNAGVARLRGATGGGGGSGTGSGGAGGLPDLVQFIDGDCELQPGWLPAACAFLADHPRAAAVCGRLRERFPEASLWNRLCDAEWDIPAGPVKACGGIVLLRRAAFEAAGGFDARLIAGEEPELCLRLRAKGWQIWRIDAEMALHDAAMTRFGQFWRRARRAGHTWAEGAAMHGRRPERHGVPGLVRALGWGLVLPLAALLGAVFATPWALLLLAAFPLQVARMALRAGGGGFAWQRAFFLMLSKFAEVQGIAGYLAGRLRRAPQALIEYK